MLAKPARERGRIYREKNKLGEEETKLWAKADWRPKKGAGAEASPAPARSGIF